MKYFYRFFLFLFLMGSINVYGQTYKLVESDNSNPTDIYPVIMGDTTSSGARVAPNTIYQLQNGKVYLCNGTLRNKADWALQIEAEDLNNTASKPIITRQPNDAGKYIGMMAPEGNLSLKNLWVLQGDRGAKIEYTWGSIRLYGKNSRVIVNDCILEKDRGGMLQMRADSIKLYVDNTVFRNAQHVQSFAGNGRMIDTRSFAADTVKITRCYMYNTSDRIFRSMGGTEPHNYVEFDHNTIFRQTGRHGTFQFRSVKTLKITNNLLINPQAFGTSPIYTEEQRQPDNEAHKVFTLDTIVAGTNVTFAANNIFWDQELLDYYDSNDSVSPVNVYSDKLVDLLGGEDASKTTYFSEPLTLNSAPDQKQAMVDYVTGAYLHPKANTAEMYDLGLFLIIEDKAYAETPYDLGNTFDFSQFDGAYDPTSHSAVASTEGRAVGAADFVGTGIDDKIIDLHNVSVYPNPVNDNINFEYTLNQASDVNISIYDITGKMQLVVLNEHQMIGIHKVRFDIGTKLIQGIYFANMNIGSSKMVKKIIVQ